jgi:hypothetical protein
MNMDGGLSVARDQRDIFWAAKQTQALKYLVDLVLRRGWRVRKMRPLLDMHGC